MPAHPRLYRRGATYYHRAAIPVDIKGTYPKTEETFSLGTKDYQEALKRVRVEAVRVDGLFEEHRRRLVQQDQPALEDLTPEQVKHIEAVYYAYLLEADEEARLDGFEVSARQTIVIETGDDVDAIIANHGFRRNTFEEYIEGMEEVDASARYHSARGQPGAFFEREAEEVLSWEGIELRAAPDSMAMRKAVRALQQATIKAAKAKRLRNVGEPIETPPIAENPASEEKAPNNTQRSSANCPKLSVLVEEWIAEKARTSWTDKTEREHRVWVGHFITLVGDRSIDTYGREDGRAFKKLLMELPANWNKQKPLKGLSVDAAASRAKELGLAPMSDKNMNKLIGYVGSFWTWAEKHYDGSPRNPLHGLQVPMRNKRVRDERDPFSTEELTKMFNAPLYTGCESLRRHTIRGSLIPIDAGIYWVPLVGLFSGARAGEIIQLYVDDIREKDGFPYLHINADGADKRLKTTHSLRSIPLHPTLIDLGFLKHVNLRKKHGVQRLFPEMNMGKDGYYSSPFSKHFSRFLVSVGIKTVTNSFHSFRHSFEDACRDARVSKEVMDALQGHSEQGMSGRYGGGFSLELLAEEIRKIQYRGLDLSHLKLAAE